MTSIVEGERGQGNSFGSPSDAIAAFNFDEASFRAKVHITKQKEKVLNQLARQ